MRTNCSDHGSERIKYPERQPTTHYEDENCQEFDFNTYISSDSGRIELTQAGRQQYILSPAQWLGKKAESAYEAGCYHAKLSFQITRTVQLSEVNWTQTCNSHNSHRQADET